MGVSRDATSFEPEPVSNAPVSKSVAREFTRDYESFQAFIDVPGCAGASNEIQSA